MQEAEAMICEMIYEVAFAWQVGPKGIYPVRTLQYPEKGTELSLTNQAATLKNATSQRKTLFRLFKVAKSLFRKSEGLTPSGEIVIDAEAHNAAGPLGVSVRSPVLPGAREFVEAAEAAGIPRGDYNGRDRGQMLPPASSRTLSPRLPAGRLYRLPMDSPRFSAILPRAT